MVSEMVELRAFAFELAAIERRVDGVDLLRVELRDQRVVARLAVADRREEREREDRAHVVADFEVATERGAVVHGLCR